MDDESVKRRYYGRSVVYEIGIDPGLRTWNATVRRNIRTGKEVCMHFLFFLSLNQAIVYFIFFTHFFVSYFRPTSKSKVISIIT
jgi:hypothetical protein